MMMYAPVVEHRTVREMRTPWRETVGRTDVGSTDAGSNHAGTADVSTAKPAHTGPTAHVPAAEPADMAAAVPTTSPRDSRDGKARDQEQCQCGPAQSDQSACHGISPLVGVIPG
jgi:hypothetical protein